MPAIPCITRNGQVQNETKRESETLVHKVSRVFLLQQSCISLATPYPCRLEGVAVFIYPCLYIFLSSTSQNGTNRWLMPQAGTACQGRKKIRSGYSRNTNSEQERFGAVILAKLDSKKRGGISKKLASWHFGWYFTADVTLMCSTRNILLRTVPSCVLNTSFHFKMNE